MNKKTRMSKILAVLIATVMLLVFVAFPLAACGVSIDGGGDTSGTGDGPGGTGVEDGGDEGGKKGDENEKTVVYTVTFDVDGGSSVQSQQIEAGGYAKRPTAPTKSGYTLDDWYRNAAYSAVWDFDADTVDSNITLYAHWTKNVEQPIPVGEGVTATFNVGYEARIAGASNPAAQRVASGKKLTEPSVSLHGCTITGWYVENGDTKWDFAKDTLTADATLFARWSGTIPGAGSGSSGGGSTDPDAYTPSMSENGCLYIHYLRADGNYDGWHIWAWNKTSDWFEQVDKDESGAVYKITLSEIGANTTVNFLVVKGAWGSSSKKDGEDNNSIILANAQAVGGSYHWYVQSGNVANGTGYFVKRGVAVDRSYAKNLAVMNTADNTDDMGVGYQIFVATFCDSDGDGMGDIQGIISKLDYLESLNVDVLWLTPIQSSDSYHGYDCYDYYAIDPKFGTNADYRELVYKAHQRGIKVIMDLIVNHTSRQNEWFIKSINGVKEKVTYQDGTTAFVDYTYFYRWSDTKKSSRYRSADNGKYYYSSFSSRMPELNYDYQPARDAMADVAMYWMAYGLDGFRMDAVKHVFMWDESENASGDAAGDPNGGDWKFNMTKNVEFFKEFNYRLKTKYPGCFLLSENLTGDTAYVAPFYAGMDSLFDFNTYYSLPGRISGGRASSAANAFNSNAASYEKYRAGAGRAINSMISSNHDVARLSYQCGNNVKYQKLYFAVIMTLPGLSWIYYGDEIGMYSDGGSGFSDKMSRQPMKWTANWEGKATAGNDVKQYGYDSDLASVAEQTNDKNSLLSYVRALTKLRNDYPALIHGEATCSESTNGMLKIVVKDGDTFLTVYHNFSSSTKTANATSKLVFGSAKVAAYGTAVFSNK